MYSMYIEKVLFPVTPGSLSIKIGNQNKTITLIDEGEVNLIKMPGLSEITIDELLIPSGEGYPFARYESGFQKAGYYMEQLEKWKNSKKPVSFKLVRMDKFVRSTKLLWDTSMSVTIEDYELIEDAEKYGKDLCIKLSMKEYRTWGAKKLKIKKSKTGLKGVPIKPRKKKSKAKTYTIKSSDRSLHNIAKKQLGDGSKWKKLYELNKKVIEKAAKKHGRKSSSNGRYLYKGTKLKLPK